MVKSFIRLVGRVLAYNWKYYALAIGVFVAFWQVYSVCDAVSVANDKLATAMHQNAAYFEKAFLDGDVFETQRILWRIKNDNVKRITFHPIEFQGSKWIFKEAVIGNLYDRPWAQRTLKTPFISNGAELGQLEYVIDLYDVNAAVFEQNYILFITVVLFFFILLLVSNLGAIRTIIAVEHSVDEINRLADSGSGEDIKNAVRRGIGDMPQDLIGAPFAEMTGKMTDALQNASRLENELAISKAMSDLAAQVAHDIRSPLAAMDAMLKDTSGLPEEKRVMLRNVSNRIRDIANDLLERNRQNAKSSSSPDANASQTQNFKMETVLLSSLVDPVITEKRLQLRSRPGINIDMKLTPESYGLFADVDSPELKRMLSNLINNAAESLGETGSVTVTLSGDADNIFIKVQDDGKGIPADILPKLGQKGETHGKQNGNGLGLYHARSCAESWGGKLDISSEVGKGTTITVTLPKANPPQWFVPALELPPNLPVIILDDDTTVHGIWQGRLASARINEQGITMLAFTTTRQLRGWVKENADKAKSVVYLLDYELLGSRDTGISVATELGIERQSILVTSRYEEQHVLEECRKAGMKLLPKTLSGIVPIKATGEAKPKQKTAVLIDDDALVHMTWKMSAKSNGINLRAYKTADGFLSECGDMNKATPVYIDSELGDGFKGEDIAKALHEKGFTNIHMATGHAPEQFKHLTFLKGVIGKDPPWE
jgi:signal transduction histidine kinase